MIQATTIHASSKPSRKPRGSSRLMAVIITALVIVAPAHAHDFWIIGERGAKADAAPVIRMHLGHRMHAEESRAYTAASTRSFRLLTSDGTRNLAAEARDGADPFHTLPVATSTPALVVLDRLPVNIALDQGKFADYLGEEHLTDVLEKHSKRGGEGREHYTRHIKMLVTGNQPDKNRLYSRFTGQALEIVLLDPPLNPGAGRKLRARVLFGGKPLAGRTLTILQADDGSFTRHANERTARTDAEGIVSFAYDKPGLWMLRMVHMHPCSDCPDAEYRSYWAAYAIQSDWLPPRKRGR